jgi:hypothetical protein
MVEKIKKWYNKYFKEPFTVAYDLSPFWNPYNEREELKRVNGLFAARRFAKKWVREHGYGQARILEGHHYWQEDE